MADAEILGVGRLPDAMLQETYHPGQGESEKKKHQAYRSGRRQSPSGIGNPRADQASHDQVRNSNLGG